MTDHTRTEKIDDDSIFMFVVIQVERKTVMTPLILYLTVHEKSMDCVLGQHDETRKKKHAIYYLSKKFTEYESKYPLVEKMCCALAWTV